MFMLNARSSIHEDAITVMTTKMTTTAFCYVKVKVKSLHTVKAYRLNRARAAHILKCNREGGEWTASCLQLLYLQAENPWYSLTVRLGGHQNQSDCFWR
jgi:hypothetical protein